MLTLLLYKHQWGNNRWAFLLKHDIVTCEYNMLSSHLKRPQLLCEMAFCFHWWLYIENYTATWRYKIFKTRRETSIPKWPCWIFLPYKKCSFVSLMLWRVIERALYSDFILFFVPLFAEVLWVIFCFFSFDWFFYFPYCYNKIKQSKEIQQNCE